MTPDPPSSSDGSSLPPRQRPNLSNLSKETTEKDLWALDEASVEPKAAGDQAPLEEARPQAGAIPLRREQQTRETLPVGELPPAKPESEERVQVSVNVRKSRMPYRPQGLAGGSARAENEFDDLEAWEDAGEEVKIRESTGVDTEPAGVGEPSEEREPASGLGEIREESVVRESAAAAPEVEVQAADDEFSPVAKERQEPVSLRPRLGLSMVERVGLILLAMMILLAGTMVFVFSVNRLPRESEKASAKDFPIQGELLTVRSAKTYWRAPVTEGPEADTFRIGTKLLPVLELGVSGGPAAIRVHFKNDENTIVGDTVSRRVDGGGTMKIAATAGFDDMGMHAAYRTGESKPWTVEVYEAPSENAPSDTFKKLFEMEISTDRR